MFPAQGGQPESLFDAAEDSAAQAAAPLAVRMRPRTLDEVTADMRLEYPGRNPFRPDSNYPEQVLRRPQVRFRAD